VRRSVVQLGVCKYIPPFLLCGELDGLEVWNEDERCRRRQCIPFRYHEDGMFDAGKQCEKLQDLSNQSAVANNSPIRTPPFWTPTASSHPSSCHLLPPSPLTQRRSRPPLHPPHIHQKAHLGGNDGSGAETAFGHEHV
jgi:hypothetical protein